MGNGRYRLLKLAGTLFVPVLACGADFGFSVIIRAGLAGAGDWELGIGPSGNNSAVTAHLGTYYGNNTPQRFEIGYTRGTNTAFARFYETLTSYREVQYQPLWAQGPGALSWEIPTGSLYVRATQRLLPTSISATGMALSGPISVLQPLTTTTLTATQWLSNVTTGTPAPIQFTSTGGGSWMLSGRLQFANLSAYLPIFGASRSQLHLGFSIDATRIVPVPEPTPFVCVSTAILLLVIVRRRGGLSVMGGGYKRL